MSPPPSAAPRTQAEQFLAGEINDITSRQQLLSGNFLVLGNTQTQNSTFSATITFPPEWNVPVLSARARTWSLVCGSMNFVLELMFDAQITRVDLPTSTTFTLTDSTDNCLEIFFAMPTTAAAAAV